MPAPPSSASPAQPPPTVLMLSVWQSGEAGWHARLVGLDTPVLDFSSPFELARFLASLTARRREGAAGPQSLR